MTEIRWKCASRMQWWITHSLYTHD